MLTFDELVQTLAGSDDVILTRRVYVDMAGGDLIVGHVLGKLVYWHSKSKDEKIVRLRVERDGHWWVAKGREDWWDECRVAPRQVDRCVKVLQDEKGLVVVRNYHFHKQTCLHWRIVREEFVRSFYEHTDAEA